MTVYSRVLGTGSYLPAERLTNHDLVERLAKIGLETSDEWIKTRSGISARHFAAANELTSDLAVKAAQAALKSAGIESSDLDLIILATSTPDHLGGFPSTACVVQDKLGAHNHCAAFDVQAVCAGFTYALAIADAFIRVGTYKKVMVLGAETFSRILNFQDRTTSVLFGDGAGAVILEASAEPGILSAALHADGSQRDILCVPGRATNGGVEGAAFLTMDGPAVFKLAVKVLEQVAHEALEKANLKSEQIDWLVPHQANIRIMEGTARKMGMSMDKVIVTVHEHGNTSAASIPLALDAGIRSGQIKRGQHLLLEGVGGGFAWGAVTIKY
ncbi:beta-ketoacyl-ACP synthase III [Polynucleobacter sphagniphilus]|jgi:3-oxoacyl-[acyl-carrier-protein] synthase-3|uniref:Beta-ketoacyl-[acyl-carrier-protein] synthase III n=1 Tax=Polynucleobacter sphagniphilus TaxID=1743169 RepID=A0AA43M7F6_9BURK|nr:beta-ketoacyl-ACP synthase III [Polynucleobacter sphagniphilus]MDF9787467.1 3-oxoacyl-[acyl-carrier-protein] synthase-3 [Polynucleobacter sphagniphilus]MDH6154158.1 3-oxoacyl-[acyl-carrier-protein] synthase-3 [Polynucleobacter sphagniphilus]MDH6240432.1 3-oxoacyl-[acyl-carrier-protein] synthase-3 [Polynucleobacter sphagniphilus]MDH6299810.1 3-oxoacyl-[acyl-carrier-protein] synthase-3 [Polynucleobacter sphagniphilus]MDH6503340.1 3-oxoacyl-[acyl-carrier-protein] synthase-3 [Polynucleobacter s